MNEVDRHLIHSFPKGQGEEIQVAVRKYKGRYYVDLRQWFENEERKTFFPTKKGVMFPLEYASELSKSAERVLKFSQKISAPKEKVLSPD